MLNNKKNLNKIKINNSNLKQENINFKIKSILKELEESELKKLFKANSIITEILRTSVSIDIARERLYHYLNRRERYLLSTDCDVSPLELDLALNCIKVLKNIISPLYEDITNFSALKALYDIFRGRVDDEIKPGFVYEFIHLFKGISCNSGVYGEYIEASEDLDQLTPEEASVKRSTELDDLSSVVQKYIQRYKSGLDEDLRERQKENRKIILEYFNAEDSDWYNYKWHLRNSITRLEVLENIVNLDPEEKIAIKLANKYNLPFVISPYYLSLMNFGGRDDSDFSIRAQVIPTIRTVTKLVGKWATRKKAFDFMKEAYTSPIELITRRYPQIVILKPVNTCPQICTYCQRNWEILLSCDNRAIASKDKIARAVDWIKENENIEEVLITGGDPLILSDNRINELLHSISRIDHVKRIRIGTRMLVTLPYRFTDKLIGILNKFHKIGYREIAIVTHFEHVSEVTPDVLEAIGKIKKKGINIYNQEVFSFANSRKFESVALRKLLKISSIDPYYTFNTKGKEETYDHMVPIARLLQERKEEVRLTPGLDRTDEPVFNVPGIGKNYLKSFQDHKVIMILRDGSRVYEFHPWEKNIKNADVYYYKDVPIFDYLMRLKHLRNEDIEAYKTIWYYY